jgi:hypothetical protein
MVSIQVPVLDKKADRGYRIEKQPLLLPHQIMAYIFDEAGLELCRDEVRKFWVDAHDCGEVYAKDLESYQSRIPLGFYGDAAQLFTKYKKEKLMCLWMNIPIWRPRSVRYSRFLLWTCDAYSLLGPQKTLNAVLGWIVWSFNALYEGRHPATRLGGAPLSGSFLQKAGKPITLAHHTFQVVELRGDWEFHKMVWNFQACGWNAINVCFRCPARSKSNASGFLYWNCAEDSAWQQGTFSTAQFIAQRLLQKHVCGLISSLEALSLSLEML